MRMPLVFSILVLLALDAAAQTKRYHLELEATPAAVFPYLGRFGAVEVHAYASGVRAEALWLDSFSKNGAAAVTVVNPLARMYVDVSVAEIAPILQKLAGSAGALERGLVPERGRTARGKVSGIDATRHRLVYGPAGWIDYWTTDAIPENPQLRRISEELVRGISPGTAALARTIRGTPVHVELNFRRFPKTTLLKVKKLTFDVKAEDEQDALTLGSLYIRAPLLEKLLD
ncbi:MAG TPA: hypothetical protein VF883_01865 [Thermoanaerobaculia bacterium]|jgi:hypothetical protein